MEYELESISSEDLAFLGSHLVVTVTSHTTLARRMAKDVISDEKTDPLYWTLSIEPIVKCFVVLEMRFQFLSRYELSVEAKWHAAWHLEATYLLVGLSIKENEIALILLLIVDIGSNVDCIFFNAIGCVIALLFRTY